MFKSKTTFVIGAGASAEVNLPTGFKLTSLIARMLDFKVDDWGREVKSGDKDVFQALRSECQKLKQDFDVCVRSARQIANGMGYAVSIDNYIDTHRGDGLIALCGKFAIAKSIIDAEKQSLLYFDPHQHRSEIKASNLVDTWYHRFIQILHTGIAKDNLHTIFENVSIITFNYDRCIEHFLLNSIKTIYNLSQEEAEEILSTLKIYHPYGQVGFLPWQQQQGVKVPFGGGPNQWTFLSDVSNTLKTFTEKYTDQAAINLLRTTIEEADTLVFLGFGYYEQNMRLIKPENSVEIRRTFGTVKGISLPDTDVVKAQVREICGQQKFVQLYNGTCVNLFDEYWRTFST